MKIFLIEDDAALAAELEALLRRYGYETARPCGFEAVSYTHLTLPTIA